jgi:hypothetical protein
VLQRHPTPPTHGAPGNAGANTSDDESAPARGTRFCLPWAGEAAMPREFDAKSIAAMRKAWLAACNELERAGKREVRRDVIAVRIIAAARRGERDPTRLREAAFVALPDERE